MKQLIDRNYKAVVNRGLINDQTTINDFINKLHEEVREFTEAYAFDKAFNVIDDYSLNDIQKEEAGDVIVVMLNMLHHINVDVYELLTKVAEKNEKRCRK